MKYRQTSVSRLSGAGRKFLRDGEWHPFETDGKQYYRLRGKILQRATLAAAGDESIFENFQRIESLHPRLFREGFREEIAIERERSGFVLTDVLIKPFPRWKEIAPLMREEGIAIAEKGSNALSLGVHFSRCEQEELAGALLRLKAFVLAAVDWTLAAEEGGVLAPGGFPRFYRIARDIVEASIGSAEQTPGMEEGE